MKVNILTKVLIAIFLILIVSQACFSQNNTIILPDSSTNYANQISVDSSKRKVVVNSYTTQFQNTVTSAITIVEKETFNQGVISDPYLLLQGKAAGLQIYTRGDNPNGLSSVYLRGPSSLTPTLPLVVIDGVIGASLSSIDPNDIESFSILKDGSAAAVYGMRGSAGVILITTKKGISSKRWKWSYQGQVSSESATDAIAVMDAEAFRAVGGVDLGSQTDWLNEITYNPVSYNHGLAVAGAVGKNTAIRLSSNYRNKKGTLRNTGFDQFNARLNVTSTAFQEKFTINFITSYTNRTQQNGFPEALRYATFHNPTAPVLGVDAPFSFNSEQFGGYYEMLGIFDAYNPVSIVEQNRNDTDCLLLEQV